MQMIFSEKYKYSDFLEYVPKEKKNQIIAIVLKRQHPALYASALFSALHERRVKFRDIVKAQFPLYEKAITILVSKEIDTSNDDHGELKEVAQAAFSLAKMSDKERQRLALRLMNIMEIIDQLEHYLEVLDNPRDNMAALWLRDPEDPDEEPDGNVLPLIQ